RIFEGNHVRHIPGQVQTAPQLGLQGDKDPVDGGIEIQVAVGADEVNPLDHVQDQVLHLVGGVDQVLAVEDEFPPGFLPQVGNQLHNLLVILKQILELLKELRKAHQVRAGLHHPDEKIPEALEKSPHQLNSPVEQANRETGQNREAFSSCGFPLPPGVIRASFEDQ